MTNAIAKPNPKPETKPSAIRLMASRLSVDETKLAGTLKATVFKNATDEELMALVVVSNEYQLNPFLKEIYAFPAKGGGIVPIVSVDGWNKMLIRQPEFDGIEFEMQEADDGLPFSCTAVISLKNRSKPVRVTEYYAECVRNTEPWKNMPRRMLRNRTLCQASRMAFGFSGVLNDDEAATVTVDATVIPAEPPPKLVAAPDAKTVSPQSEIESFCLAEGFTFDHFRQFAAKEQGIENADSMGTFAEMPADFCKRMLRAKAGLKAALAAIKEGQ